MSSQEFQQVQKQSQSMVLAPQLRNSLKILQVPAMELRTAISQELQNNPLLEELPGDTISVEERIEDTNANERDSDEELAFDDNDYSVLERMTEDMREQFSDDNAAAQYGPDDEERREHFMNSLTADVSLQEHLIEQAKLQDCPEEVREALFYLIGSLDEHGYLPESLSDIALASRIPYGILQTALEQLKSFDPPGIGARDLRDCLATQLEFRGRGNSLAARILRDHYSLLIRRRIPELTRKTGASSEEVQAAIEEIATLEPAPGKRFNADTNTVIEPDVTVYKDEYGAWKIELNNDYIPRLRISGIYKELLAKGKLGKKEKDFMMEKMRAGRFLINSIEQRQQTIERITRELLELQKPFFDEGVSKLRPLTMSMIAQRLDVHETTVSRAVANKFIRTPHGVFSFKYFFTPGFTSADGESVSNKSIKEMISQIVEHEDSAKPYSDQDIVERLKEKNIKIARRTVAKYREELGILPTNLRRRY
ncbi:MAG: RNA polymerase factor sigma-54 [Opitutales bacterium]